MPQYPGVDTEGFIQSLPEQPLQPAFRPLVNELCTMLSRRFPALLDGLYLYGSVARGEARPGTSDLDATLVLAWAPSPEERQRLEQTRQALEAWHPEVSKIDFDIGVLSEVLAPDNLYRWGFWLKHQCRCIWGNDLRLRFEPFRPSRRIAQAVNGDFPRCWKATRNSWNRTASLCCNNACNGPRRARRCARPTCCVASRIVGGRAAWKSMRNC
nr:nucleotidyltransferase domain-containing protein [Pseudomonas chlororaphis]